MAGGIVCGRCGAIFQQGIDHFDYPVPAPGYRPGRVWAHYRPGTGRRKRVVCVYGDGESDPRLSPVAAALAAPEPEPEPDAGVPLPLVRAGGRRAA